MEHTAPVSGMVTDSRPVDDLGWQSVNVTPDVQDAVGSDRIYSVVLKEDPEGTGRALMPKGTGRPFNV